MFLIVGLGNPGTEYAATRHNIGFDMVTYLSDKYGIALRSKEGKAIVGKGVIEGQKVMLVQPQTYMNLSGESVRALMDYYKLTTDEIVIIYDDISMPVGQVRIRPKGSAGGHNGIKSIIMSTVSKTNRNEIPDIIDEVVKAKVRVFAFSRYVPTGGEVDTSMTPEEYRKLLEVCDAKYKAYEKAGCETYFNKKDHLWTLYEYETGQFKLPESTEAGMIYGGCNCGNCHITISSNGDIMACRRVTDSKVANIFEDRLADVWICQMEKYRDYDKFIKCSKCELKAWCRGCPAVANGTSGNFYGTDPQCWKTRNEITGEVLSC